MLVRGVAPLPRQPSRCKYCDGKCGEPVCRFGWGLSHTSFAYEWAAPPRATVAVSDLKGKAHGCCDCSAIRYSVRVTNTGAVAGDAVVLGRSPRTRSLRLCPCFAPRGRLYGSVAGNGPRVLAGGFYG